MGNIVSFPQPVRHERQDDWLRVNERTIMVDAVRWCMRHGYRLHYTVDGVFAVPYRRIR